MKEPLFILILLCSLFGVSAYAGMSYKNHEIMNNDIFVLTIDTKVVGVYPSVSATVRNAETDYFKIQPNALKIASELNGIPAINTVTSAIKKSNRYDKIIYLGTNTLSISIQGSRLKLDE